jgi:hypothetical protein
MSTIVVESTDIVRWNKNCFVGASAVIDLHRRWRVLDNDDPFSPPVVVIGAIFLVVD